jgi:hypothetical protein
MQPILSTNWPKWPSACDIVTNGRVGQNYWSAARTMNFRTKHLKFLKKLTPLLLVVVFFSTSSMTFFAKTAEAKPTIWYHGKIEDPALKRLVGELKSLLPILFKMLFSLDWLKSPRKFYRTLKRIIVVWYKTMVELCAVLLSYIFKIDREINSGLCANRTCT